MKNRRRTIQGKIRKRIIQLGAITFVIALLVSYLIWLPSVRSRSTTLAEGTNKEIISRLETTLSFVENYTENLALSVAQNASIQQFFSDPTESNKNIAMLTLSNLTSYEGMIRAVSIEVNQLPLLDSLSRFCEEDYELLSSQWYQDIRKAEACRRLSPVYRVTLNHIEYYTVAYGRNFYINNRWYTFVVFVTLNDTLFDVQSVGNNAYDYFLLRDSSGATFYTSGDDRWASRLSDLPAGTSVTDTAEVSGGIALTRKGVRSNWSIVSFISDVTVLSSLADYSVGLLISLLSLSVLLIITLSHSLSRMMRPIISLAQTMDETAKGDLKQKVEICSDDEVGLLQQSYNKMVDDLRANIALIAEKERREQEIKFSLLISQIDPHFICNTINSTNYLARKQRNEDIVTVNKALMTILRDRLRVSDIEFTDTVAVEMHVVEQYMKIQHFMYGGDFHLNWQVEDGLLDEKIPKNMIQPLVENALFHGLINEESGEMNGEICIKLTRTAAGLLLTVRDNGVGMDEECLRQVNRSAAMPTERGTKIGLSNISARLYYLYGNSDCLHIESEKSGGTTISILFRTNPPASPTPPKTP